MRRYLSAVLLIFLLTACAKKQDGQQTSQDTTTTAASVTSIDFQEAHRPQFHFTPPAKWMNDPNGMVYHNGEYHLFYQYNPDSTVWGPMHWGHAVSRDMIRWEHLPVALYPDSLGTIFSGSAVVDANNTSGLGSRDNPPMVAVFTSHRTEGEKAGRTDFQTQSIAYSTDNGRTWKKYAGNPVLPNPGIRNFRDPKVSWHEPSGQWVMILAVADHVELYGSKDLKSWNKLSEFGKQYGAHGGVWECPDLFPLELNGHQKWVMLVSINPGGPNGGSATQYFTGSFDGKTFTPDHPAGTTRWLDHGKDNYAGVTWANVPASDGRRLFIGWMSNWEYAGVVPTGSWRSAMTIARELALSNTPAGLRVLSRPVKELASIRGKSVELGSRAVSGEADLTDEVPFDAATAEVELAFDSFGASKDFGLELSNDKGQKVLIGYQPGTRNFYVDRSQSGKTDFSKEFPGRYTAPRIAVDSSLKLHLVIDVASVELFADNGQVVMTEIFFPDSPFNRMKLFSREGSAQLTSGKVTQLKSSWKGSQKVAGR
jgi:fructan beta-fructosidase